jgi:heat shock protein HslJ
MNPKTKGIEMNRLTISILLLGALLLGACASTPNPGDNELAGTNWVLVSLDGDEQVGEAIGGQAVTLQFMSETEVGGSGGCNSFGGDYQSDVRSGTVSFSNIVSTLMACVDEGIGEVETQYFEALNAASHYELANGQLSITGGGHMLVFVGG